MTKTAFAVFLLLGIDAQEKKPAPPSAPPAKAEPKAVDPFVTLPVAITGSVGEFILIKPTTNGKEVRYVALDSGLNVFPSEELKNSKNTVVSSSRDGKYRLLAYTALGGVPSRPAITVIVVGTPPEPKPNPDPPPGPQPDPPPAPPVRPSGLPGEIYDQMASFPKAELKAVNKVVKDRLALIAGIPDQKKTLIKDIISDMQQKAKLKPGTFPWSPFINWLKGRLLEEFPVGTDEDVVIGVTSWSIALEALSK